MEEQAAGELDEKTDRKPVVQPPWSPLVVSIVTLLLPAGGAILTVWNLRRMGQLDRRQAINLSIAVGALFVVGLAILLLSSNPIPSGKSSLDPDAVTILSVGAMAATYVAQRSAFRLWRLSHMQAKTSSWIAAFGIAVSCQLAVAVVAAPMYLILSALV